MTVDAKYYCETMNTELTAMKARIYHIVREMDRMQESERVKLGPQISDLFGLVDHLQAKIDELNQQCPPDWKAQKEEIDKMKHEISGQINLWDAEHIAGGYVGG
ncbi:MAG: hypothetical protein IBX61_06075 [Thermoleophilia bacterium]|nr:hypothetical protein [Thermoleophilia bacterium]